MKNTDNSMNLLTGHQVASILKISTRTLYRMIATRRLPALKIGGQWRVVESQLTEWMAQGYEPSASTAEGGSRAID